MTTGTSANGVDVISYGATSGLYSMFDASENQQILPGLRFLPTALTASGAIPVGTTMVTLSKTGGGIAATIAAPAAGRYLIITQTGAETEGHTVTLTAGTYDGTNSIATFNAAGETLVLVGISATRFLILQNIGAVGLSAP